MVNHTVFGIACWAAIVLPESSIVALVWDGPKPELAGKTFANYVGCPVCMALVLAGGVSGRAPSCHVYGGALGSNLEPVADTRTG